MAGKSERVVTQLDLERRYDPERAKGLRQVVMIQCAGSRAEQLKRTGLPYCSRFCCLNAVKNATLLKKADPYRHVYVLYRDLMTYGAEGEDWLAQAKKLGVRFLRYRPERPPAPLGEEKLTGVRVYHEGLGSEVELAVDTLVLITPLVANAGNPALATQLKVPLIEEKFFLEAHVKLRPVEFATDGIYVCGAAKWPCDVPESVSQALGAAAKAAAAMGGRPLKVEAITAHVDPDLCRGCGVCEKLCPYSAIELRQVEGALLVDT